MNNKLLKAALWYADQGFYLIPLKPRGKSPVTPNGYKNASKDPEQIKEWWRKYTNANIGLLTGKINDFIVFDIDGEYPEEFPKIPVTPTVKTYRGVHYYLEYPKGISIPNKIKFKGKDVDIKSDGGYIVAPPSIHPEGSEYEIIY